MKEHFALVVQRHRLHVLQPFRAEACKAEIKRALAGGAFLQGGGLNVGQLVKCFRM